MITTFIWTFFDRNFDIKNIAIPQNKFRIHVGIHGYM